MIFIGADHRGFELKEKLKYKLLSSGYDVTDMGNDHLDKEDDYVDYAVKVAKSVAQSGGVGILLCGSGEGVNMAANKVKSIRAALAHDKQTAVMARQHEDANVISLPADVIDEAKAFEIANAFLQTKFTGEERHVRRIRKLKELEEEND